MKLFELYATLGLDFRDFASGLSSAGGKMQSFAGKAKDFAVGVGKAAAATATAATAATAALLKNSIDEYAEYEQLVGGVDTLFKESSKKVQKYANMAQQTAGMSANEYMANVTSFSASLLQSLGGNTAAAAEAANQAIIDMSDNANKMGTDISMIQNAYQGFAKQNYTMLDNLKLGYGGTKEEMERLLEDAEALSGKEYNINNLNDVYEAIHVIQTELGITGTTAKEASETISGSFASWKASWTNFLTFLSSDDEAQQRQTVDDLVKNTETVFKNIGPAVKRGLQGIWTVARHSIKNVMPKLRTNFTTAWNENLPKAATSAANSVINKINSIFGSNIPTIDKISLPKWEDIETSFSTWWSGMQSNIQNAATWTLQLFQNPSEGAEMISAAIGSWWTGTAEPAIKSVSTWALNLFGTPIEDDATIADHVGAWWKKKIETVTNACSWVLQLFGMPTESAETITSTVSGWWKGIADLVTGACNWFLEQPEFPSVAEMVIAIVDWWKNQVLPALPELAATASVKIQTVYETLSTGLSIAGGQEPTPAEIDVISSPTIYKETGGQYGMPSGTIGSANTMGDFASAVVGAVREGMQGLAVNMDGRTVGNMVTATVSKNIAREIRRPGHA